MNTIIVKKTSLRMFLITTFMLSLMNAFGYGSAKVNKVWLEHGVTKNGERGLMIHADITASGIKGNRIEAIAYFYDEQKNKLMGGISGYKTNDGQVCAWDYGKSSYDDSRWKDFDIFIPFRALPLASGQHTYYIIVDVKDVTQNKMMTNNWDYVSFTGTGNKNHIHNYSKKLNNFESRLKIGNDDDSDDYSTEKIYYPIQQTCVSAAGVNSGDISGDKSIKIQFNSDGDPVRAIKYGRSFDLEYFQESNGMDVYTCDGNENNLIAFSSKQLIWRIISDTGIGKLTCDASYSTSRSHGGSGGYSGGNNFNYGVNGGGSSSNSSTYRTCPSCNGTGTCSSCHGRGGEWQDTGYYTGSNTKTWFNCPSCNGSKRCFNCHGSGRI